MGRCLASAALALALVLGAGACSDVNSFEDQVEGQRATGRTRADAPANSRLFPTRTRGDGLGLPEGYTQGCTVGINCPAEVMAEFGQFPPPVSRCTLNTTLVEDTTSKTYTCRIAPEVWLVYP